MSKYVAYYRVSTDGQGESGLGLRAQQTAVARYVGDGEIIESFEEVESGKNSDRPQLHAAIHSAKRHGAILIVAKLDRLARNVLFTATLMESGVEFIACDIPYANRLTIHIMAAMAEDEARRISERTTAALAERKSDGVKLGAAREGFHEKNAGKLGWNASKRKDTLRQRTLQESWGQVIPIILALREADKSMADIADHLNRQGYKTPRGGRFHTSTISRIIDAIV